MRQEEEAVAPAAPELAPTRGEAPRRASSLPSELPTAQPPVTEGDAASRPELVRAWLLSRVSAVKSRELDLIHGPPASLKAMHVRHQVAAAHWKSPVPRNLRVVWGWLHTAAYALLLALMDAAFSPAGAVLAVLALLTLVYWL
jgi:hypothetical protein